MEAIFTPLLIIHIVCGAIGLITGTINLLRRKGDQMHRAIGRIFVNAMLLTGFSAIALSLLNPNHFLTIVGLFTIYMVGTGFRYIRLRLNQVDNDPKTLDWVLTYGMGITGVVFVALGVLALIKGNALGMVYVVFGVISLLFVRRDMMNYRGMGVERNYWLMAHLQRMTGAYIAAMTAFLVVNADYLPSFVPGLVYWLVATAVLTPLIVTWSRKYRL
jgi:uncharacterized membrane protein